ncbi:MAG: glycosyltransferase family 2 protein [Candidatus Binataceae bacterium]
MPTRNEEHNIDKCLASVAWSDDVYVVDSDSKDRTVEIAARRHKVHITQFRGDGAGPRKLNWALEHLPWKHDWVFTIGADEEMPVALATEILHTCRRTDKAGFLIRYWYYFLGRRLQHGAPLWKLTLMRHAQTRFERINIPEVTGYDIELHEHPIVSGPIGRLNETMVHRDSEGLHHFIERHNIYSDWEALLRTKYKTAGADERRVVPRLFGNATERRRWLKLAFLASPGRPFIYFLHSYLWRLGFLDGRAGFYYASLMAAYWFQIRAKEYELRSIGSAHSP